MCPCVGAVPGSDVNEMGKMLGKASSIYILIGLCLLLIIKLED